MPSLHHACLPCSWASLQVGDALLEVRPGPRCSSCYLHAGQVTPISLQLSSPHPGTRKKTPHLAFPLPLASLTQQAGALFLGSGGCCCWGTKPIADLCHPAAASLPRTLLVTDAQRF